MWLYKCASDYAKFICDSNIPVQILQSLRKDITFAHLCINTLFGTSLFLIKIEVKIIWVRWIFLLNLSRTWPLNPLMPVGVLMCSKTLHVWNLHVFKSSVKIIVVVIIYLVFFQIFFELEVWNWAHTRDRAFVDGDWGIGDTLIFFFWKIHLKLIIIIFKI